MTALFGLSLQSPAMLALALLVPMAIWVSQRRASPALRFVPATVIANDPSLPRSLRLRVLWLPAVLESIAVLAAVVALARPVERTVLPTATEGIDILLCCDVSSSMTATDMDRARSRLAVARDAAVEFASARPADRIGLITFARFADLRCPLTLDHAALTQIIGSVSAVEADGKEDATGIGAALARGAQVLRGGESETRRARVLILLTDGEETVATAGAKGEIAPAHGAQLASELGVRVYVISVGSGSASNATGAGTAASAAMTHVAARTGGRYFQARDAESVGAVYREIDQLERAAINEPTYAVRERFAAFLGAAIFLMLAGQALRSTWLSVTP